MRRHKLIAFAHPCLSLLFRAKEKKLENWVVRESAKNGFDIEITL